MHHESQAEQPIAETLFNVNLTEQQIQKFWNKIRLIGASENDCWEWTRALTTLDYGVVRFEGRNFFVHRVSYFLSYGSFPNHLKVCHKCDHPRCCRPDHLFLGTQADNLHDMFAKDRRPPAIGTRIGCSKLNETLIRQIRAKYATGKYTHRSLAKEYGVAHSGISKIVNGLLWTHVSPPSSPRCSARSAELSHPKPMMPQQHHRVAPRPLGSR